MSRRRSRPLASGFGRRLRYHRPAEIGPSGANGTPLDSRAICQKKKLAEPEGSAKFEQGGFTSRRRKDPKTLFPGASPGNLFGAFQPKNCRRLSIARVGISRFAGLITNGNSVWLVCKNRNAVGGPQRTRVNSPQSAFSSIGPRLLCAIENRETR